MPLNPLSGWADAPEVAGLWSLVGMPVLLPPGQRKIWSKKKERGDRFVIPTGIAPPDSAQYWNHGFKFCIL
jgi:hypothetical protein